jgi:hypothetical protein
LKERNFDDYVAYGTMGGRPIKWNNNAERMKAERIQVKLSSGQLLKDKDKAFLATLNPELAQEIIKKGQQGKIGRPRKYHPDRAATPAEQKREQRKRKKY